MLAVALSPIAVMRAVVMDFQKISQASLEKFRQLHTTEMRFPRLFRTFDHEVKLITELGDSGEPGLLLHLTDYVFHSKATVRLAAKTSLSKLLHMIPVGRLPEIDVWTRTTIARSTWRVDFSLWRMLDPTTFLNLQTKRGRSGRSRQHASERPRR